MRTCACGTKKKTSITNFLLCVLCNTTTTHLEISSVHSLATLAGGRFGGGTIHAIGRKSLLCVADRECARRRR